MSDTAASAPVSEQEIIDAYLYLLSRFLVVRQEQHDINVEQVGYNTIKYNPLGSAQFVNPNLDVAYLEAWIAVDREHAVILNVPEIQGRYYTVQVLDGWGEVIANVNQRNYPDHPHGKVAFALQGAEVPIPQGSLRIDLPATKAKILARVELQDSPQEAVALQRQFTLEVPDGIVVEAPLAIPPFTNAELITSSIFPAGAAVVATYPDAMPTAAKHQAVVSQIADYMASSKDAAANIEHVVRAKAVPYFLQGAKAFGAHRDGWSVSYAAGRFGDDILARAIIDFGGLWANTADEAIYFIGQTDADLDMLQGSNTYVIRFPASALPEAVVDGFWSLTLYSVPDYHVVANPIDRYNLNSVMSLEKDRDGSLSLWLAAEQPPACPDPNWLPTPAGSGFSLNLRLYVAKEPVLNGDWFPAPIRNLTQPSTA